LADGELRELLEIVDGSDIEELELEVAGTKLHFRRLVRVSAPEVSPDGHQLSPAESRPKATFVVAERVGFFHYSAENGTVPRAVGDSVLADQVIGVIDSLNVPSPVAAPCSGVLGEVLVDEGQAVEYGQPLFVIECRGD